MRASAIGMVVLAHYCERPCAMLIPYGVELFFALSGYLIGGILFRQFTGGSDFNGSRLLVFWKRRWYRTLPNYYLALLAFTAMVIAFDARPVAGWWSYLFFSQNFAWPMLGFFVVSWSLAVEEWFYLLFPAAIMAIKRCNVRFEKAFAGAVVLFIALPIVFRSVFGYRGDWHNEFRMIVVYRLDALMYGVAVSALQHRFAGFRAAASWLGAVGLAALLGGIALHCLGVRPGSGLVPASGAPAHPALFFVLVPAGFALMLPIMERCPRPAVLLANLVQRVSEWSYSIYLWHVLIYLTARRLLDVESMGPLAKTGIKLGCLGATLWLSKIIYNHFELFFIRKRPSDRQTA